MITITKSDAFRGVVDDNRLIETALLDVCEVIARRLISGKPTADVLVSLDFLRVLNRERAEQMTDEERADMLRREAILQRAYARAAELRQREHDASKPQPMQSSRRAAAPVAANVTADWQRYIADRITRAEERTLRIAIKAVGQAIGQDLVAAERRITALEAEVRELRERLDRTSAAAACARCRARRRRRR